MAQDEALPDRLTPITGATNSRVIAPYPGLQPVLYALETVVPPASAVQAAPWVPTGWIVWWLTLFKGMGWVLTVLLLAGITGILRKT